MEPLTADDPVSVGTYRLVARLGEGGMGQVYLGFSAGQRAVAIKIVHAQHARDAEFRARFRTEIAAARTVNAAFTAAVIDAGEDDNPPWLVTTLVPGPSLAELMKAQRVMSVAATWRLMAGLAEALQAVHACGLVHRDLKPANVLLATDGPRLIDFGLSRALDAVSLTATGFVMGTPQFMSPEQAAGTTIGPASDVFSLGSLLVFAATGHPPFGTGQSAELLFRIMQNEPDFGSLTGPLLELAGWCLAKDPGGRPTPAEIMRAIPDDSALPAVSSAARFWPAPEAGFIAGYQSRFELSLPGGQSQPAHAPTQPFRPPKEIAAEVAELTNSGQAQQARQVLSSAAKLRPDQEVAALISILRRERRHGDIEIVTGAAVERPAAEIAALADVLREIGSEDDADKLLDQAGHCPAGQVVAIAAILAGQSRTREYRRLLHSAVTRHREPAAVTALVKALSSVGLGQEGARLMGFVAAGWAADEVVALADSLRAAGQDEAAFPLYSAAIDLVSKRPAAELASLLRAMRQVGQDATADQLIEAVCATARQPSEVADLAAVLWAAAPDDARRVLDTAAAMMAMADVMVVAESLLGVDRAEAALHLSNQVAARHPVAATASLVQLLREAGRPIDARRVLESSQSWPAAKTAELIVSLRSSGSEADADRVLAASQRLSPDRVGELLAALSAAGADGDAAKLVGLLDVSDPDQVSDVLSTLLSHNQQTAVFAMLAWMSERGPDFCCELVDALSRRDLGDAVTLLLRRQAHEDLATVIGLLRLLRSRGNDSALTELLGHAAQRPADELTGLVVILAAEFPDKVADLLAAMKGRTTADLGLVIAALPGPSQVAIGMLLSLLPDSRLGIAPLAAALDAFAPQFLAEFLRSIVRRYAGSGVDLGKLVVSLRVAGLANVIHVLLEIVASSMEARDFCDLFRNLELRNLTSDAAYLFAQASRSPNIKALTKEFKIWGYAKEVKQLRRLETSG